MAGAYELNGGVSLGGFIVGTTPRLAVSPHAGVLWRMEHGLLFAFHDIVSILPPISKSGVGIYNQTSAAIGYTSGSYSLSIGPSLSIYSIPACGITLCGRVVGIAPGGHAQAQIYMAGPFGISLRANVDWIGGRSLVLPGGLASMLVIGPVLRWKSK